MPEIAQCPNCRQSLKVPDNLIGTEVVCPGCNTQFVAQGGSSIQSGTPVQPEQPQGLPLPGTPYQDDKWDDYERGPQRRPAERLEPHRGGTILTLGIVGIIICGPLCIAAWVMGEGDLKKMRKGYMDPSGQGTTQAGRILGIIGTILWIVLVIIRLFLLAAAGPGRF